jgi:ABC-type xylose transport system permease subunit
MKFALNHSHRFDKPKFAFFISFSLLAIMLTIEVVNFLMILQTNDLNNLIQNVTALVIIAEADVLLYSTLKDEVLKDLLTISTF